MTDREGTGLGLLGQPRLAPAFLACLPLFACYELGLALSEGALRNGAEGMLTLALRPLGSLVPWVRIALLVALAVFALRKAREDEELRLGPYLRRVPIESVVLALLLGPLLILMLTFFDGAVALDLSQPVLREEAPRLAGTLRLLGAAPWEELLFRVAAYGLVYLLVARIGRFLGAADGLALLVADLAAILLSSVFFAVFHLDAIQSLLGREGEEFVGLAFLWRLLAGLLLAGIFRWRGLGVVAWTHGLFNVALALGAGPGVG